MLATGKFAQYPTFVTDSSENPVTYQRYVAALWLKAEAPHGSLLLIAPYNADINAFEASRDMAPYAYLKEYFIDETRGHVYDGFVGYIPLIGDYYNQYWNRTDFQTIYSNGKVEVGYKWQ